MGSGWLTGGVSGADAAMSVVKQGALVGSVTATMGFPTAGAQHPLNPTLGWLGLSTGEVLALTLGASDGSVSAAVLTFYPATSGIVTSIAHLPLFGSDVGGTLHIATTNGNGRACSLTRSYCIVASDAGTISSVALAMPYPPSTQFGPLRLYGFIDATNSIESLSPRNASLASTVTWPGSPATSALATSVGAHVLNSGGYWSFGAQTWGRAAYPAVFCAKRSSGASPATTANWLDLIRVTQGGTANTIIGQGEQLIYSTRSEIPSPIVPLTAACAGLQVIGFQSSPFGILYSVLVGISGAANERAIIDVYDLDAMARGLPSPSPAAGGGGGGGGTSASSTPAPPAPSTSGTPAPPAPSTSGTPAPPAPSTSGTPAPPAPSTSGTPAPPAPSTSGTPAPPALSTSGTPAPPAPSTSGTPAPPAPSTSGTPAPPAPSTSGTPAPPAPSTSGTPAPPAPSTSGTPAPPAPSTSGTPAPPALSTSGTPAPPAPSTSGTPAPPAPSTSGTPAPPAPSTSGTPAPPAPSTSGTATSSHSSSSSVSPSVAVPSSSSSVTALPTLGTSPTSTSSLTGSSSPSTASSPSSSATVSVGSSASPSRSFSSSATRTASPTKSVASATTTATPLPSIPGSPSSLPSVGANASPIVKIAALTGPVASGDFVPCTTDASSIGKLSPSLQLMLDVTLRFYGVLPSAVLQQSSSSSSGSLACQLAIAAGSTAAIDPAVSPSATVTPRLGPAADRIDAGGDRLGLPTDVVLMSMRGQDGTATSSAQQQFALSARGCTLNQKGALDLSLSATSKLTPATATNRSSALLPPSTSAGASLMLASALGRDALRFRYSTSSNPVVDTNADPSQSFVEVRFLIDSGYPLRYLCPSAVNATAVAEMDGGTGANSSYVYPSGTLLEHRAAVDGSARLFFSVPSAVSRLWNGVMQAASSPVLMLGPFVGSTGLASVSPALASWLASTTTNNNQQQQASGPILCGAPSAAATAASTSLPGAYSASFSRSALQNSMCSVLRSLLAASSSAGTTTASSVASGRRARMLQQTSTVAPDLTMGGVSSLAFAAADPSTAFPGLPVALAPEVQVAAIQAAQQAAAAAKLSPAPSPAGGEGGDGTGTKEEPSNAGAIVGAVLGVLSALVLLSFCLFWVSRRERARLRKRLEASRRHSIAKVRASQRALLHAYCIGAGDDISIAASRSPIATLDGVHALLINPAPPFPVAGRDTIVDATLRRLSISSSNGRKGSRHSMAQQKKMKKQGKGKNKTAEQEVAERLSTALSRANTAVAMVTDNVRSSAASSSSSFSATTSEAVSSLSSSLSSTSLSIAATVSLKTAATALADPSSFAPMLGARATREELERSRGTAFPPPGSRLPAYAGAAAVVDACADALLSAFLAAAAVGGASDPAGSAHDLRRLLEFGDACAPVASRWLAPGPPPSSDAADADWQSAQRLPRHVREASMTSPDLPLPGIGVATEAAAAATSARASAVRRDINDGLRKQASGVFVAASDGVLVTKVTPLLQPPRSATSADLEAIRQGVRVLAIAVLESAARLGFNLVTSSLTSYDAQTALLVAGQRTIITADEQGDAKLASAMASVDAKAFERISPPLRAWLPFTCKGRKKRGAAGTLTQSSAVATTAGLTDAEQTALLSSSPTVVFSTPLPHLQADVRLFEGTLAEGERPPQQKAKKGRFGFGATKAMASEGPGGTVVNTVSPLASFSGSRHHLLDSSNNNNNNNTSPSPLVNTGASSRLLLASSPSFGARNLDFMSTPSSPQASGKEDTAAFEVVKNPLSAGASAAAGGAGSDAARAAALSRSVLQSQSHDRQTRSALLGNSLLFSLMMRAPGTIPTRKEFGQVKPKSDAGTFLRALPPAYSTIASGVLPKGGASSSSSSSSGVQPLELDASTPGKRPSQGGSGSGDGSDRRARASKLGMLFQSASSRNSLDRAVSTRHVMAVTSAGAAASPAAKSLMRQNQLSIRIFSNGTTSTVAAPSNSGMSGLLRAARASLGLSTAPLQAEVINGEDNRTRGASSATTKARKSVFAPAPTEDSGSKGGGSRDSLQMLKPTTSRNHHSRQARASSVLATSANAGGGGNAVIVNPLAAGRAAAGGGR